jgi:hypothetical protein
VLVLRRRLSMQPPLCRHHPSLRLRIPHRRCMLPIAMFDGLAMFASNLFKFAQIPFKFIVDTGPNISNFPNFVQFGVLQNFSTNES